jgi:ElaB/YqjD/DUF883 family membrane-anchored ribosome-binding protein
MEQSSAKVESGSGGPASRNANGSNANGSIVESMSRGRDAIGTAANEAMNSAGSDLQALREDLNGLRETLTKFIGQAGNEAMKSAREVTGQVSGAAGEWAGKSAQLASEAGEQAKGMAAEVEAMARRNPLGAIATAVIAGVLIGIMGHRR